MKHIPKEHPDLVLDRLKKGIENLDRLLDWDEFSKKLLLHRSKKKFDAKKFNGAIKVDEEVLAIQRRLRKEWE